jgi:transcriptional regulator with XRE-family HTH domain
MTAGELLREARERSGMKQREIAAVLGLTASGVALAEARGDRLTVRRVRDHLAAMGYELHLMVTRRSDA